MSGSDRQSTNVGSLYDEKYFLWQSEVGRFGGWANLPKFQQYITKESDVLDFGCGGGFLLSQLECARRLGVEINPVAAKKALENGVEVFTNSSEVPDKSVDVIISNHALEHVPRPLDELVTLKSKVKLGGIVVFVLPCESVTHRYRSEDVNHHLYSWSPMAAGHLFHEAGFQVLKAEPYLHSWPRHYQMYARFGGRRMFELACRVQGFINRRLSQVRVVACLRSDTDLKYQ